MEIEAKYRINSDATYTVLKSLTHVGEYTLATGHTLAFRDIYYDTEDHHLISARYALRERR